MKKLLNFNMNLKIMISVKLKNMLGELECHHSLFRQIMFTVWSLYCFQMQ